jgi:tetratricopeptide (TPR) repeat protein
MPDASTNIATQGGAVTGNVTTGGDFAGRDLYKQIHYHTGPTPAGFVYVGVPSLPHHFLGRDELVADLVKRLCTGQTTALSADGLPGVGKTTLAVALARHPQILAHFRDGILWAGLGRLADVASIQATWGDALGVDLRDLPHPYARTQRLTNAMGHRRLLLVLDDVWQWEPADQLRCSAPGVATLLTTRDQALARRFAGAQRCVNVPVLEAQPAYDLLATLAPEACATDPVAAQRLAALVDGLPLALELLGGYLDANRRTQARRQQALTALTDPAARLALASQRLGDPHHQAVTLQATIALSLADLPAATVAAFHALGAFAPKPARFTLPAALAVTGADEETIFTLADRNLVEMGADETLALHQTLSALARTQLPPEVTSRHRDYYLAQVNEDREDWQRIETIYEQVSFAWSQLSTTDASAIQFVDSLATFQTRRGLFQDRLRWLAPALAATQQQQEQKAEARMLHEYGAVYSALGEKEKALAYYEQALPLWRQGGDKAGEAVTLNNIGAVYDALGEKEKALAYYEQALPLWRQVGDKAGEATTLNNIGGVYDALGKKAQALAYYEQALPLRRQVGDRWGESVTCYNMAMVYRDLEDLAAAEQLLQRTVDLDEAIGHPDLASDRAMLEQVQQERRAG